MSKGDRIPVTVSLNLRNHSVEKLGEIFRNIEFLAEQPVEQDKHSRDRGLYPTEREIIVESHSDPTYYIVDSTTEVDGKPLHIGSEEYTHRRLRRIFRKP